MKQTLIALVVLVLIGAGVWFAMRPPQEVEPVGPEGGNGGGTAPALTAEQVGELMELRNTGLGYLENQKLDEAAAAFTQITTMLPQDPMAWRDLAITRVLRIETGLNAEEAEQRLTDVDSAVAEARDTLNELEHREPESVVLHFLRGKLASLQQDPDQATREFMVAGTKAAGGGIFGRFAPGLFYEAYTASAPFDASEETRQMGRDALQQAHAAAPQNLFIALFWIVQQAESRDPALAESLAAIRPEVESASKSKAGPGSSPLEYLDMATQALQAKDWDKAKVNCRFMTNLLKAAESSKSDFAYEVSLHVLDFVSEDFAPSTRDSIPADTMPDDGVAVSFSPFARQIPAGQGALLDARLSDLDLDGRLDVCLLRSGAVEIWTATQEGDWELLTSAEAPAGYSHLLLCDLDDDAQNSPHSPLTAARHELSTADRQSAGARETNDDQNGNFRAADPDVVLYGEAGIMILENVWDKQTGQRHLAPPAPPETPPGTEPPAGPMWPDVSGVSLVEAADLNLDGDLDFVLITKSGARLWSNRNSFLFQDVTDRIEFPAGSEAIVAAFPVDWDRDVDLDVVLAMQDGTVGVLECLRYMTFRWRPLKGVDTSTAASLVIAELDGNVSWDLLVGGAAGVKSVMTRTSVAGRVDVEKSAAILDVPINAVAYWDYDNDGYLDSLAWNRDHIAVARGMPHGAFSQATELLPESGQPSGLLRCETGDLDADGDTDLLLVGDSGVVLWANEGGNSNGWLDVTLAAQFSIEKSGESSRRVNHYGLGNSLELKAGPQYQAQVVRDQQTHFGIGQRERADVIRMTWTNGLPQNVMRPKTREHLYELETPTTSCPYLYAWNGERFEFVTDLLWAAPLGLPSPAGGLVRGRGWEYLLVPAELLQPRENRYVLQLTCELWEADYFDQVELIAVDHPEDIDVYSNEKVGPPEICQFLIHTARERHSAVRATNHAGRDLLAEVRVQDNIYARSYERRLMQGYTDDTWLELDLGPTVDPRNVKLFLTGWMFPTAPSMNVALAENPALPGPQPPSLWVPDEHGEWQQVIPFMGFPGGKTKTIVVDLSGKFLCDDHRVRITTSMELYWDEIFFTSGEQPGECTVTPLTPVAADLHYRGFSRRIPQPHNAPPVFDYDQVHTEPAWAPMGGHFTRYGGVTELVNSADDRMAILASGDELTVEFDVPPGDLPVGWKRDFILHNVGWDKDADLNTVLGQTVEPLPFAAMSRYPYPATESYPDTPLHQEYLRNYQTRTVDAAAFRRLIHAWRPGTELMNP